MKNILFKFLKAKKDEQTLIAEIHNEFDSAEDRLLEQANEILETLKIEAHTQLDQTANRLANLGFINTPLVKQADVIRHKRIETEQQIVKTKSQAELIQYYKYNYPFQKFLTEDELDKICRKYNLIYAPVKSFIKDVPEKNLKEIETAQNLKESDRFREKLTVKINSFWEKCPNEIKKLLKHEVEYTGCINRSGEPSESDLKLLIKKLGYVGNYTGYIYEKATVKRVNKEGLFICAPPSHFDLSNLSREGELGYYKVETWEINDPIVFRYCRGGIQVLSKWGLEASDEALVNEINN